MFAVIIQPSARKSLRRLPRKQQEKIRSEIDVLAGNPFAGKKLEGVYEGKYTWRVWPYRIIYIIEKKIITVTILEIGHRQGVYK